MKKNKPHKQKDLSEATIKAIAEEVRKPKTITIFLSQLIVEPLKPMEWS
jgi:hypothetical protein